MQKEFETFLERLAGGVDYVDFRDAMAAFAKEFDLRTFAYLSLTGRTAGEPVLISNYPPGWTSRYQTHRYHQNDPVILRAQTDGRPFRWGSGFGPSRGTKLQQRILDEAAEFEICSGLTIPVVDRRGGGAAVTFAAGECNPTFFRAIGRYEQALQLIATCFHIHVRRSLAGERTVDGVVLTPREYECLQWAARGKSAWDIGCILGIQRRTVAFHLDNARKKLGVRTITQAVVRLAASPSILH